MIQKLIRHLDTPCDAVTTIDVEVEPRAADTALDLTYVVRGNIAGVLCFLVIGQGNCACLISRLGSFEFHLGTLKF